MIDLIFQKIIKEMVKLKSKQKYNTDIYDTSIVDLPNFIDYDITHLIKNIKLYTEHIIMVYDLRNPIIEATIKKIQPALGKFSVLSALTDAVDTSVVTFAVEFAKKGKVLVATSDTGIIKAIASSIDNTRVGFFIHDNLPVVLPVKDYKVIRQTMITRDEGLVKRILRISSDTFIKQAKGNPPGKKFIEKINELAPIPLEQLYKIMVQEQIVKNYDHFLKGVVNMAINKQIWLKNHPEDVNLVIVQKTSEQCNNKEENSHQ